ncbi:TolC family protein [Flavobacterium gawalongense]|uniref:TolC family protein n=1 Tax=Flavobacterium gawalongense TaxID=2594432 RepID=A0A553BB01_9FLAO|nr:TolC family protein [Flavobacterium gawalongense]TRX01314.1 TolC family protein [Flavobacterium gawalongense]TRX05423.1 TolC family protein [Flavobacterium gawalongense]TRX05838.1 TolC family protein [Flavobacterium gawalongense]TRX06228.1 TolC family protein [Flavobacterium gawalongense]TRX21923.1 TolC family protein [Flavobacterium gawalongense]
MKKIISITFLIFAIAANAQESNTVEKTKQYYAFSLEEAINHALVNNYTAINASRDINAAKKKKWETTAMGLPQINASLDYTNNFELQKSLIPAEFFGGNKGEFAEVAFGTKHNMTARATLSQLIFDGSYIVALQASKTYLKFYENAKQKTQVETKEMVINAYGNVLLAEEGIAILEKNKATLEKTLFDTKETFKSGLIEEENVEQLQITLTSIVSNLNYNKRLLDISYKMLKITLGIDINDDLKLTDKLDNLTISNLDLTFNQDGFNVNNNINYQMALNFEEQRELELKLQKSKALPTLTANMNFGYNAFGNQFEFFTRNQKWLNYSNLGMTLNVPIFSGLARTSRTQQAKIALEQAKTQLTETEQKLKLQYASAKSDYEFSIEEYETAKENLKLAERIEKKQQTKFTEGLSTSFDFNDAQRQLYDAQQKYLQSMVEIINKKASLEKVINKI